jgi:threonine/homoserine/homoserine lactone efflux protein
MFDGIILTLFGAISLALGIANKGPMMWVSWNSTGIGKKIFGPDYKRVINILFGAICLFFGLFLLLKKK